MEISVTEAMQIKPDLVRYWPVSWLSGTMTKPLACRQPASAQ
jgi:hypothetical protein